MISWLLALGSAVFLGFYDLTKKASLRDNAVLPVLFLCSLSSAVLLSPALLSPDVLNISLRTHLMLLGKAFIVTASWVFTFHALSHLPLSIAAPIRASAPLFTILLAVSFMGERPSGVQWFGIILLFLSYYTFSVAGKKETGSFWNNRWVIFMFIGTLLGALSGIYDKFLIQSAWISPTVVQVWFSVYLTLLQGVILGFWTLFAKQKKTKFKFRWIILLVGGFLVIADRLYFMALNEPGALISTVSVIRRTNVIVSFCGGIFLWKEKLIPVKLLAFTGIMTGLIIIGLG